ncbi:hypothetical protein [Polaromonas sp. C04]|uniref:hypothetical protein n=1 Tax=Polaromonas sp. C04 TaxID=1945857 RepID=UPI0009867F31|nr:hypothetical protein [Polaromonas sp. C04]OOG58035.1 hypothetical protein B0E49_04175 [Polaromonas sp. C04]
MKELTQAIPLSCLPPVALERPLSLFGASFEVLISTGFTLSPHTVLQSALDKSFMQLGRGHPERPDRIIHDFWRGVTGKNVLSETTRIPIRRVLGKAFPADVLEAALDGQEPPPLPRQSDWQTMLAGLGEPGYGVYPLVERLAHLDRVADSVWQLFEDGLPSEALALMEQHVGLPLQHWSQENPSLPPAVVLLVDISLQTLAWFEWQSALESALDKKEPRPSRALPLLAPARKPVGNWLGRLERAAGCANLKELADLMLAKGIKRNDKYVSYDLLKKWSSGLMPPRVSWELLKVASGRVDAQREHGLLVVARFLTFLCDLVVAGTRGEARLWKATQGQIRSRYAELYASEGARRGAP